MKEVEEALDPSQCMSVSTAAKYMEVSLATMYRWIKEGRVTQYVYDELMVVSIEDLRELKQKVQRKRILWNGENNDQGVIDGKNVPEG